MSNSVAKLAARWHFGTKLCHQVAPQCQIIPPGVSSVPLHKATENGNLYVFQSYIENMLSAEIVITEDVNPEDDKG